MLFVAVDLFVKFLTIILLIALLNYLLAGSLAGISIVLFLGALINGPWYSFKRNRQARETAQ